MPPAPGYFTVSVPTAVASGTRKKTDAASQSTMVPGPACAAAEIQRMLIMQATENNVRSRTPSSRRSFGVFAAVREVVGDAICEIGRLCFPAWFLGSGRDYTLNRAGASTAFLICD